MRIRKYGGVQSEEIVSLIGTVGEFLGYAMVEALKRWRKTELIYSTATYISVSAVVLATVEWVLCGQRASAQGLGLRHTRKSGGGLP